MKEQKYLKDEKLSIIFFIFMFVLYSVVFMTKNMFSAALAFIVEEGFMTKSQTGFITAAFWFVYAPLQVVGGIAADKYSPYKLIMIGLVGSVVANLIIYFNQNYYVMLITWVSCAIVQFGIWPSVFKITSTHLAPKIRPTAVFWMLFATSLGLGMSMFIASFVPNWRYNFLVSALSLMLMSVLYFFFNSFLEKRMTVEEIEYNKQDSNNNEQKKVPMLPLMLSSGFFILMINSLLRNAIDNAIKMMTPVMLMESYENLPAAISTRLSTVLIIFLLLGTLIAGIVKKKVTQNEPKAQLLFYIVSLVPLFVSCFLGRIHYIWILAALAIGNMLIHGAAPFCQSFVALHFEKYDRIATASGILNAAASVGNILASYVFAKMAEIMPWSGVVLSWLISIAFCGVLCIIVTPRWTKFTKK